MNFQLNVRKRVETIHAGPTIHFTKSLSTKPQIHTPLTRKPALFVFINVNNTVIEDLFFEPTLWSFAKTTQLRISQRTSVQFKI